MNLVGESYDGHRPINSKGRRFVSALMAGFRVHPRGGRNFQHHVFQRPT